MSSICQSFSPGKYVRVVYLTPACFLEWPSCNLFGLCPVATHTCLRIGANNKCQQVGTYCLPADTYYLLTRFKPYLYD